MGTQTETDRGTDEKETETSFDSVEDIFNLVPIQRHPQNELVINNNDTVKFILNNKDNEEKNQATNILFETLRETLIASVNNMRQDLVEKHREIKDIKQRYEELEKDLKRLKEENQALKQQNNALMETQQLHSINAEETEYSESE